jgi:hypothetical protein
MNAELAEGYNVLQPPQTQACCFLGKKPKKQVDEKHNLPEAPTACDRYIMKGPMLLDVATHVTQSCGLCTCNAVNALRERHGVKQPECDVDFTTGDYGKFLNFMKKEIAKEYDEKFMYWAENWIKKWPKGKREMFKRAAEKQLGNLHKVKAHVKDEPINKGIDEFGDINQMNKARLIQAYGDIAAQLLVSIECYAFQKAATTAFDGSKTYKGVSITIASEQNCKEKGDWFREHYNRYSNPMFYERDGENWDATQNARHFAAKLLLYEVAGRDFVNYMSSAYRVNGTLYSKNKVDAIRYTMNGTVKSGHVDTSIGNGLVNALISATCLIHHGKKGSIIVTGDDLLVIVEGDFDVGSFVEFEKRCGIIPKAGKIDDPERVTFASGVFVPCGNSSWAYIPMPGRNLAKLYWSRKPPGQKRLKNWLYSVSKGMDALLTVPVVSELIRRNSKEGKLIPIFSEKYMMRKMAVYNPILPNAAIAWFRRRYGFDVKEIERLEELIRSAPRGSIIKDKSFDHMLRLDSTEPDERDW